MQIETDVDPRYTDAMYDLIGDLELDWLKVGNPNVFWNGNDSQAKLEYYAVGVAGRGQRSVKIPRDIFQTYLKKVGDFR